MAQETIRSFAADADLPIYKSDECHVDVVGVAQLVELWRVMQMTTVLFLAWALFHSVRITSYKQFNNKNQGDKNSMTKI